MAKVRPLSSKAKNRLANVMDGNPSIQIEQRDGNKVFFVSANGKYCAWAHLASDPHWEIIFSQTPSY